MFCSMLHIFSSVMALCWIVNIHIDFVTSFVFCLCVLQGPFDFRGTWVCFETPMRNPVCNRRVLSVEWLENWNFHVRARCSQSVQKRALCHSFLATTTSSSFWTCLNLYEFSLGHGNNWALGALAWTVLDVLKFQEILISSILPLLKNTSVETWKCFHCRFFHWGPFRKSRWIHH